MITTRFLTTGFLIASLFPSLHAQCSDAGVCTLGGGHASQAAYSVSAEYAFGTSGKPDEIKFHSIQLSAHVSILPTGQLLVSIPYNRQSGPLGSTSGIGDLTIVFSHNILTVGDGELRLQIGGKLALAEVNDGGLPQAYQSGLGTNDILAGIQYRFSVWNAAIAYQIPFGRSDNNVTRLKRGDDLLLRLGYSHALESMSVGAEIFAIKRLQESSVLDTSTAPPQPYRTLTGSDQTQINLVGRLAYPLGGSVEIQALVALPLLKRDINVDGLTRAFSASAGVALSL
ncbi:MAG: hypothetical protein HY563_05130 [Ignavibacteriales bacterium]|nr:hypothetical protein [Ignavibacteriales bacterium]